MFIKAHLIKAVGRQNSTSYALSIKSIRRFTYFSLRINSDLCLNCAGLNSKVRTLVMDSFSEATGSLLKETAGAVLHSFRDMLRFDGRGAI
jgi:hypothetical protein